ncbi:acetyl-CoA hydrolase/transferase family protein [Clostridium transplantifaecale]|uniref:acetyl-CoA hydrolase/transferase family protein n=1 Tax=Clostridium transplantifaecale TaxID=2479838 RepID=UPI000F63235F|nr:acetyl-CoA hydrolase/transferase C-terminal domain-containing protein [Clostridium transplantifaecale]
MERLWEQEYENKKISAEKAVSLIKDGDSLTSGAREPATFLEELGLRTDLKDVVYFCAEANFLHLFKNLGKGITVYTSFLDSLNRGYAERGLVKYLPSGFSGYRKNAMKGLKCNVALPTVSKPNKDGYVSFGNSADLIPDVCREAELVIAEINEHIPFVYGDNVMHISEFDFIVEGRGYPMNVRQIDDSDDRRDVYKRIGGYLSELIETGATLEVGIGRLNSSSLMYLENARDLGVHTEVYGDIFMELTKKGIITNQKKVLTPGVSVCTQIVGSRELLDYAATNLEIRLDRCNNVLNPGIIARNNKMTAINNAIQMDLLGQGNAEYLKGVQYSGMGGIADFAVGAANCPDGKSIIVIESTTRNGKFSKIVPYFTPGTPVSLSRVSVEYVVTEYGIATLIGKSLQERAKEMIRIAHPGFREELEYEAEKLGL